jgi:hypothetical protein
MIPMPPTSNEIDATAANSIVRADEEASRNFKYSAMFWMLKSSS